MASCASTPVRPLRLARRLAPAFAALLVGLALVAALTVPRAEAATSAPGGLKVVSSTPASMRISWSAVKGAPKYRVQYSTSSSMAKATYKRFTTTSAELTGLRAGTRYYVKVRVISADGDNLSPYSKAVSGTTPKSYPAPSGLKVTARSTSAVALKWGSRGSGVRYRVQYATKASMSGAKYVRFTAAGGTVRGLKSATKYWFKVRVITAGGDNLSPYSKAVASTTKKVVVPPKSAPLRVASFNIKCANCYAGAPDEGTWYERRSAVVSTILGQHPDVLGVQEASQGWLKDSAGKPVQLSQFEDLRNRLGDPWTLTNTKRNNCEKSTTPSNCVRKDQGASQGTKILFDSSRVSMLDSGSKLLPSIDATSNARYVAWAIFSQRSTGKKFFFADTHLEPSDARYALRKDQAEEVAATIKRNNPGKLPVVVVGDWNSSRFEDPTNAPYDVLVGAGYRDPLGGAANTTRTAPGAFVGKRVNTWLNSYNDFVRQAKGNRSWVNGSYIDYMLVSPGIAVPEWETVAKLDSSDRFVGTIPSDHNMVRATLTLP